MDTHGVLGRGARRALGALGLEVHRRGGRGRMRSSLAGCLDHARSVGLRPATVIDVGVGNGTFELYERFPEASILLIEPLREFQPVLDEVCRRYRAQAVLAVAGERPGRVSMNVHPYLEGSSIFREAAAPSKDGIPREVPVVTVDGECEARGLVGPYLLKVDVQGAELEVLRGAARTLSQTGLVLLEVSLFEFMEGGPVLHDVVAFMKDRGFVAYDLCGGHTRPLDDALAQIDVAFVEEDGPFRRIQSYDVPEGTG